jgi:DNA polymerase-4
MGRGEFYLYYKRESSMKPVIALVDMDAFLASVEQAINPDLVGKPVIVGGLPGTRGIVICASYEARKLGVGFGLPLAEAYRRLPQAVFVKGDIKVYRDYWAEICDIFYSFTPLVEPVSMDEAYLDLTGSLALFGPREGSKSPEILARQIKDTIKQRLSISCSIGIGTSKLFAKIACGIAKSRSGRRTDGFAVIRAGSQMNILNNLPVSKLPNVGHKTEKLLAELGIYTVKQLREVPRPVLVDLFGKNGAEWYEYVRGIDRRHVKAVSLPRSISRETTFNVDSVDKKFLKGVLYYLLERVCLELRRKALQARRISVKIRYVDFQFAESVVSLPNFSNSEPAMFATVERLFSDICTRKVGVRHLGVSVTRLIPAVRQAGLFNETEKYENLSAGLDRVRHYFGYHAIFYGKTMPLGGRFREVVDGYQLRTPSLSL